MTWKFSVNFEEYLLKSSGTYLYKIKMAPAVLIIITIIIIGRFISPTPGTVGLKFKTNIGRYIKATE